MENKDKDFTEQETKAALDESIALNRLVVDLLGQKKRDTIGLWIVILVLILANLVEALLFVWYESQFETVNTTTTTTTTENNIDQSADEGNNDKTKNTYKNHKNGYQNYNQTKENRWK